MIHRYMCLFHASYLGDLSLLIWLLPYSSDLVYLDLDSATYKM